MHSPNPIPDAAPDGRPSPSCPSAREVIDRFVNAVGGYEALGALRTLHLRAKVATMGLTGVNETWRVAPDRTRETMVLGPYELVDCFDGTTAWRIGLDGKLAMVDGKELEDATSGAWFDHLAWLRSDQGGGKVAPVARRDSTALHQIIEVTPPVGHPRELWFDTSSGLLSRMVETRAQPEITTEFSDYRAESGVLIAHRIVKSLAGMPANTMTMVIDVVRTNVAVNPELFVPPRMAAAAIRWLATPGVARIPFRYSMNHIWVNVSVNGGPPAEFILDSGASLSVIDRAYAASIGVATLGSAEAQGAGAVGQAAFARLDSLRIGGDGATDGVELADRPIGVLPIAASISPALWRNVAGLLGADFMTDFVVDVDFDHQRLTLFDPATFRYQGSGSPLPFTLAHGVPVVPLTIDGRHRANVRVDLGAGGGAVLQPSFVEREGIDVAGAIGGSGGGFGGRYSKLYLRMQSVQLGPLKWKAPIVGVVQASTGVLTAADYDGVVGNLALRRFRCTFDYERRVLHLAPGALAEVADSFTRIGLTFARNGNEVTVLSVMGESPADEAGLRSGDVVRSVDGQPASTWDPDRLRQWFEEPECRQVELVISRDGSESAVVVHARPML